MSFHQSLVVATENKNKLKEIREILQSSVQVFSFKDLAPRLSLPEEGQTSYDENASQKALYIGSETNMISLGDDSGFEVKALGWKPGVLSARFADTKDSSVQRSRVMELLSGVSDRACRFVCVLALYDPATRKLQHFRGEMNGVVATEERGSHGFGYDAIVIPEGYSQTLGELSDEIKNQISHRAQALNFLKKQWSAHEVLLKALPPTGDRDHFSRP